MKVAVVQDHLCGIGGSERMFQYICEEFSEADIYTLAYNPEKTLPYFQTREIQTTWLNSWVQSSEVFRWSFPLSTYVMQWMDFSKYDLVISSSATTAKYLRAPNGKHVCYCYIPTRALWHFDAYFGKSAKARCLKPLVHLLKKRDYRAAQRIDQFIAISQSSKNYIEQYYHREAKVVYCPIDTQKFYPSNKKKEHYLIVSRLEQWKKVDYAIEAFNQLGAPLKVIGAGAEESKLKSMAKKNITFLGEVDDATLAKEYSECRAVVFTPFLEYGLIPLEASASGTPVICYGKGGITETMIPLGDPEGKKPTAVFFDEQTPQSLIAGIQQFEKATFDSSYLVHYASKWSIESFKKEFRKVVTNSVKNS